MMTMCCVTVLKAELPGHQVALHDCVKFLGICHSATMQGPIRKKTKNITKHARTRAVMTSNFFYPPKGITDKTLASFRIFLMMTLRRLN